VTASIWIFALPRPAEKIAVGTHASSAAFIEGALSPEPSDVWQTLNFLAMKPAGPVKFRHSTRSRRREPHRDLAVQISIRFQNVEKLPCAYSLSRTTPLSANPQLKR
jgi:hypothetical protein